MFVSANLDESSSDKSSDKIPLKNSTSSGSTDATNQQSGLNSKEERFIQPDAFIPENGTQKHSENEPKHTNESSEKLKTLFGKNVNKPIVQKIDRCYPKNNNFKNTKTEEELRRLNNIRSGNVAEIIRMFNERALNDETQESPKKQDNNNKKLAQFKISTQDRRNASEPDESATDQKVDVENDSEKTSVSSNKTGDLGDIALKSPKNREANIQDPDSNIPLRDKETSDDQSAQVFGNTNDETEEKGEVIGTDRISNAVNHGNIGLFEPADSEKKNDSQTDENGNQKSDSESTASKNSKNKYKIEGTLSLVRLADDEVYHGSDSSSGKT